MLEIVVATLLFSGIVLLLVVLLMLAQSRLVPAGEAVLMLNGDSGRTMKARVGSTLLGVLAGNRVLIPSACGGKGTCGLCKVTVTAGGGALLPTETGFIGAREARRGVRLACQVKVKGDLSIQLAPELLDVRKWQCRVMSNRNVATFIKELKLALPAGEDVPFRAGGYVQIECPPHSVAFRDFDIDAQFRDVWDRFDLWRFVSSVDEPLMRAYSMANYPDEKGILMFTIRIAFPPDYREDIPPGAMSSWLFHLKPGDAVTISGPFGEFFARDTGREMCFIGGGAGMAPMRAHIFDQFKRLHTSRKVSFWYGARSLREAFYSQEFEAIAAAHPNFSWHLALSEPLAEDAWTGPVGFIHDVLYRDYLTQHPVPEDIEYYICGPGAMNRAVIAMLLDLGVEREGIMLDDFG